MMGGFTQQVRNPDSWEGWYWGAKHVWGQGFQGMMSPGRQPRQGHLRELRHGAHLGLRPGDHPLGLHAASSPAASAHFWTQAGIKQVYICPDLNYARRRPRRQVDPGPAQHRRRPAAGHHLRVAHRRHLRQGVRRDPHRGHRQDRRPTSWARKTASPRPPSGPRRSAACRSGPSRPWPATSPRRPPPSATTSAVGLSAARTRTSPPGWSASSWACRAWAAPASTSARSPTSACRRAEGLGSVRFFNPELPRAPHEALLDHRPRLGHAAHPQDPHRGRHPQGARWSSTAPAARSARPPTSSTSYTYPIAKEKGGTPIHMMWTDTPCRITCWNHGNWTIEAMQRPEDRVHRGPAPVAGERLPLRRHHPAGQHHPRGRRHRHHASAQGPHFQSVVHPGAGHRARSASRRATTRSWLRDRREAGHGRRGHRRHDAPRTCRRIVFDAMKFDKLTTWEEFKEKKYLRLPTAPRLGEATRPASASSTRTRRPTRSRPPPASWSSTPSAWRSTSPTTRSGRRIPKWIEKGITHDERLSSERADMFPLLVMSNHRRWRTHAQGDDIPWTRETPTGKVKGFDGYRYEPIWINPADAEARGIKDGDIVKVFNERGIVLVRRPRLGADHARRGLRRPRRPARPASSPASSTAAAPSTPSPRTGSPPRTPAARPPAATWSTCRRSRTRNGKHGAGTTPRPSPGNTTRLRPALQRLGRGKART